MAFPTTPHRSRVPKNDFFLAMVFPPDVKIPILNKNDMVSGEVGMSQN